MGCRQASHGAAFFYLFILLVNPILEKRKREKNPKSKIQKESKMQILIIKH